MATAAFRCGSAATRPVYRLSNARSRVSVPSQPPCCYASNVTTSSLDDDTFSEQRQDLKHLRLHNTATSQAVHLLTASHISLSKPVKVYVCGITAYDYAHLGHARAYVAFDVLVRILRFLRLHVLYVRNITDVDDKIIARANSEGRSEGSVASEFHSEFVFDMYQLNCTPPDIEPSATEHMPQIIEMISSLIERGHAYAPGNGDVYFSVPSFSQYGSLTGQASALDPNGFTPDDDNSSNNNNNNESEKGKVKRNRADFALWKAAKEGEPRWSSPWGYGRPGWHIECSAMVHAALGCPIDVHGGGKDLAFPHHENELAQGVASGACDCTVLSADGKETADEKSAGNDATVDAHVQFARMWVHNGFVRDGAGEKMAKSIGNTSSVREVCQQYHPLALRLALLGTHYRADVAIDDNKLEQASERLYYVLQSLLECKKAHSNEECDGSEAGRAYEAIEAARSAVRECDSALADDMNTPVALSSISAPLASANALLHGKKKERNAPGRFAALSEVASAVEHVCILTGVVRGSPPTIEQIDQQLQELRSFALHRAGFQTERDLMQLIDQREHARAAKDFGTADSIREQLCHKGIFLMDTPSGNTEWRPGVPTSSRDDKGSVSAAM